MVEHAASMRRQYALERMAKKEAEHRERMSSRGGSDAGGSRRAGSVHGGGGSSRASSVAGSAAAPPSVTSDAKRKNVAMRHWVKGLPPIPSAIGTSVRPAGGSVMTGGTSVFSVTTLSHRSPSTLAVSGITQLNDRLARVEQRVADEKAGRDKVYEELQELKRILLEQAAQREGRPTPAPGPK